MVVVTKHVHARLDRASLKQFLISEAGGSTIIFGPVIPTASPFTTTKAALIQTAVDAGWPRALVLEMYDTLIHQGEIFQAREVAASP